MATEFTRPDDDLPGLPDSPWLVSTPETTADPLDVNLEAHVAVVGGGIVGLSTALACRERGLTVAVLERERVGSGATGASMGLLTPLRSPVYAHLAGEFGDGAAETAADALLWALDEAERLVETVDMDAGFERRGTALYGDAVDTLDREWEASRDAGLETSLEEGGPAFERARQRLRLDEGATLDPVAYTRALAEQLRADDGARVYEHTRVSRIDPADPTLVRTPGGIVHADDVVLASGFPMRDAIGYITRLRPRRTCHLGVRINGPEPDGIAVRAGDEGRAVRAARDDTGPLVLVSGEAHKPGRVESEAECYRRLHEWARGRFPVTAVDYRWSSQEYVAADGVPFVGRAEPGRGGLWLATGLGGWGPLAAVLAGDLLADLIDGRERGEADLFDPLRFTPKASLGETLTENADTLGQFATDWARTLFSDRTRSIDPGESQVFREGREPIAVARDGDGDLHAVSAVCPRDRCILTWNDAEYTWDCPCNGSRFSPDGGLIEGPATRDLERKVV